MNKELIIQVGDIYQKVDSVSSKWVVDKTFKYDDIPDHVRLIEQSGNERTITVALASLSDSKQWRLIEAIG